MRAGRFGGWALALAALAWVSGSAAQSLFDDGFEPAGPRSDAEAARFLDQATFGARPQDLQRLRTLGYEGWLTEQRAARISSKIEYFEWIESLPGSVNQPQRLEAWMLHAAQMPNRGDPGHRHDDQLRQRVAFAWSQIFVVSEVNGILQPEAYPLADYYDLLARHAFGNYRELLEAVTLHPAMGLYLNMLGSRKANGKLNTRPDENYAREVLQLFSIGLHELNPDGSRRLENGQPIPTFNSAQVRGFAAAFSGWNFSNCTQATIGKCGPGTNNDVVWRSPMAPIEAFHDSAGSKQLLTYAGVALPGGVLPAGGTAREDLEAALDNIFGHPNVGPFIGKQLIQRLVTSNPTPDYVARVTAVFNDNGMGVRGDLGAVVRAILLDPEARRPRSSAEPFGKLREPLLKLVRLWRVAPARSINGRVFRNSEPTDDFGQLPLAAPSVFNFYRPTFAPPGETQTSGLVAPEFQITTDRQVVTASNYLGRRIFEFYVGSRSSGAWAQGAPVASEALMDYGALRTLAADPALLVDHLNLLMLSGGMSASMRELLIARLSGPPPAMVPGQPPGAPPDRDLWRVQQALYLIVNSPEFSVQR